jgi:hypothetical protein
MEERRQGGRRAGERREFRRDEGRRDSASEGRRRSARVYIVPSLLVLLPLVLGGIYRLNVVIPRDASEALAGLVGREVRSVLAETQLPGLSFPGAGQALPVLPWAEKVRLPSHRRSDFSNACSQLPESLEPIRQVPALGRAGAICDLLLGDHHSARERWERVLAHGGLEQVAEAEVGLAILAIEAGMKATSLQDQLFSWDQADYLLRSARRESLARPSAAINLEVLRELRKQSAGGLLGSEAVGGQGIGQD